MANASFDITSGVDMQEVDGVVVPWTSEAEPGPAPEPMPAHGPAPDTMSWLSGRRQAR